MDYEKAQGKSRSIVIYYHRRTEWYPSLAVCAKQTGISRWRLARALEDPEGLIPGTRPAAYIDEAVDEPRGED